MELSRKAEPLLWASMFSAGAPWSSPLGGMAVDGAFNSYLSPFILFSRWAINKRWSWFLIKPMSWKLSVWNHLFLVRNWVYASKQISNETYCWNKWSPKSGLEYGFKHTNIVYKMLLYSHKGCDAFSICSTAVTESLAWCWVECFKQILHFPTHKYVMKLLVDLWLSPFDRRVNFSLPFLLD